MTEKTQDNPLVQIIKAADDFQKVALGTCSAHESEILAKKLQLKLPKYSQRISTNGIDVQYSFTKAAKRDRELANLINALQDMDQLATPLVLDKTVRATLIAIKTVDMIADIKGLPNFPIPVSSIPKLLQDVDALEAILAPGCELKISRSP